VPQKPKVAELDELFTFLKSKKTKSTSWQSLIELLIVCWVGMRSVKEARPIYKIA
jgi:hypothetical protein